jgi:hypothetical protein
VAPGEDRPAGIDAIARDLASGSISRRTALRRFAGLSLGALVPGALFAESALGRCPKSRRCAGKCCPSHAHCVKGKCRCRKGFTKCGKACKDLATDVKNCGRCGKHCADGETCHNGHCKPPAGCQSPAECPTPPECQVATCSGGVCGTAPADPNFPCTNGACDGNGNCNGICGDNVIGPGEVCDHEDLGGETCFSQGFATGVLACNSDCLSFDTSGCSGESHCVNGVHDGNETDVDCGGSCSPCDNGKMCGIDQDCQSGHCLNGICVECATGTDCQSGLCDANTHTCTTATCLDGVKNGGETDVDCGGPVCPGCANGLNCTLGTDCQSGHCVNGKCVQCSVPADCGASTVCHTFTCTSGVCGSTFANASTACSTPSCLNSTTVQQGGTCDGAGTCQPGNQVNCSPYICSGTACKTSCSSPGDCASGFDCSATNVCKKAQGQTCSGGTECASGFCVDGYCCSSACSSLCKACSQVKSGQPNGTCANIPAGTDPDNDCVINAGTPLGTCNGAGACQ